jgi:hypothetical protein
MVAKMVAEMAHKSPDALVVVVDGTSLGTMKTKLWQSLNVGDMEVIGTVSHLSR